MGPLFYYFSEFLNLSWMKSDKNVRAPSILRVTKRFNEVSVSIFHHMFAGSMKRKLTLHWDLEEYSLSINVTELTVPCNYVFPEKCCKATLKSVKDVSRHWINFFIPVLFL